MENQNTVIVVSFSETTDYVEVRPVHQYDHGLTQRIRGIDSTSVRQIHFSNTDKGRALNNLIGVESDGTMIASIPDVLLAQDKDIYAYLYYEDDNIGCTVKTIRIPMTPRAKPESVSLNSPSVGPISQIAKQLNDLIAQVRSIEFSVNLDDGCLYVDML